MAKDRETPQKDYIGARKNLSVSKETYEVL
jgi:hypothetical protein